MNLKKINVLLFLICTLALQPNVEAKMSKEAHALYQQACAYEYKNDYKSAIEAIQKAIDSYRVSSENKSRLKTLRKELKIK